MSHIPVLQRRHPMLPKNAAPDIQTVCAKCDEIWPCEVERLRAQLGAEREGVKRYSEKWRDAEDRLREVHLKLESERQSVDIMNEQSKGLATSLGEAEAEVERLRVAEAQLAEAQAAMDESERRGGDAPHRAVDLTARIRVLSDAYFEARAEVERLRAMLGDWNRTAVDKEDAIMARLHQAEARLAKMVERLETGLSSPSMLDVAVRLALATAKEEPLCDGSCGAKPAYPHRHGIAAAKEKP